MGAEVLTVRTSAPIGPTRNLVPHLVVANYKMGDKVASRPNGCKLLLPL